MKPEEQLVYIQFGILVGLIIIKGIWKTSTAFFLAGSGFLFIMSLFAYVIVKLVRRNKR